MPFDPEKQKIYEYCDGTVDEHGKFRIRRGDPVVIYRNIINIIGGEEALSDFWKKAHNPKSPTVREDRAKLAEMTRRVFDIKPLTYGPGGLNEESTIEVLYDFSVWQKKSETSTDGSPSISQPTQDSQSHSTVSHMTHTSAFG